MQKVEAKQQLINALIADKQQQCARPEELVEILANGFGGFLNMTASELIDAASDAGLIERDAAVASLVEVLEAKPQAVSRPRL